MVQLWSTLSFKMNTILFQIILEFLSLIVFLFKQDAYFIHLSFNFIPLKTNMFYEGIAFQYICIISFHPLQRVRRLAQPAPNWGPSQAADKERYYNSMDDAEFERYEAALLNVDLKSYAKMKKMSSFSDSPSSPKKARPLSPTNSITLYSNIINSV